MKSSPKQRTEVALPSELKRDLRVFCAKNDMTLKAALVAAVKKLIKPDDVKKNQHQIQAQADA